ncbi:Protein translocase subunit SecDF [Thermoflexales bacterium]|nr:Protein translocase subunit SecDF [Thermoflexales bacterium]
MKPTKLIAPQILIVLSAVGTLLLLAACDLTNSLTGSISTESRLTTRVTLQAKPCSSNADISLMSKTQGIVQQRLSGLGVANAKVQIQDACQLAIDLPALADPAQMLDVVPRAGRLEFVDTGTESYPEGIILRTTGNPTPTISSNSLVGTIPDKVYPAIVTGADLVPDNLAVVLNSASQQVEVAFELETAAAQRFKEFTTQAVGSYLCIVLDNTVQSCPTIQSPIPEGKGVITLGSGDRDEANRLLNLLRYGSLPYELEVIQIESLSTESESKP